MLASSNFNAHFFQMDPASTLNYVSRGYIFDLVHQAKENERYLWLSEYLQRDSAFLVKHVHPIQPGNIADGNTRVVIADFPSDVNRGLYINTFSGPGSLQELEHALLTQGTDMQGRLVFVTSISGISDKAREEQLHNNSRTRYKNVSIGQNAPVLTWPRTAGTPGTHPIKGHMSVLPDPDVVSLIADCFQPNPDLLLRFLDQDAHLTYQTRVQDHLLPVGFNPGSPSFRKQIRICIDQANHLTGIIDQEHEDAPWTVLLLAAEDNCLGIDFNENTSVLQQSVRESTKTPSSAFETILYSLSRYSSSIILKNPLSLVSLYSTALVSTFASHIELYRRKWSISYEPYAQTSVVYGYSYHRDAVRQLARRYALHLRYINQTLDSLERFISTDSSPSTTVFLKALIGDFEHFAREINALKTNCDQFLEQQVSKLALQDARASMREARDLKRISYMAFIFVPLSLTSSFFGMNVRELDSGSTPLWVFILTALAVLCASLFIVQVSGSKWVAAIWEGISNLFKGIQHGWFSSRPSGPGGNLHAVSMSSTDPAALDTIPLNPYSMPPPPSLPLPLTPKPKRTWKFWRTEKPQEKPQPDFMMYDYGQEFSAAPMQPYAPIEQFSVAPMYPYAPITYADPT